jgi:hypothetical protein
MSLLARGLVLLCLCSACAQWPVEERSCPRGEQLHDGHCTPTPSIVFQRCMEAFRTRSIEHDRGRELAVSASVKGQGGELSAERRDRERREYEGLSDDDLSAAIGECRRQEEAERAGQVARAWDEAERARADAERARIEAVGAKHELSRTTAKLERLEREQERRETDARFADLPSIEEPTAAPVGDEAPIEEAAAAAPEAAAALQEAAAEESGSG